MTKYLEPSPDRERYKAQEQLVFAATELVCEALEHRGITRRELASRVGVKPAEITQRLNGQRNLTLRSLADMLHALGYDLDLQLQDRSAHWSQLQGWVNQGSGRGELMRYNRGGNPMRLLKRSAA